MIGEISAFILYFVIVISVGLFFFLKQQKSSDQYFLGGRQLNSWVTALSAQASDMSGWLLMGLPGSVFAFGLGEVWIAVGLAIGTYLNWLFVAGRLRRFSKAANDSITIPAYLQNRFMTQSPALRYVSAIIFCICFTVYAASACKAGGTLFASVFNIDYQIGLAICSVIIIAYTFLGGFLAVCWTDFFQGLMMLAAILAIPILALGVIGEYPADLVASGYLSILPGGSFNYDSFANIISGLAWGLGYLGMPHILVRFMAIKNSSMIKKSRRIATVWVIFALAGAVLVGLGGRAYLPGLENSETVFIEMARTLCPGFVAGILLSAIMAASMSTADSQLLVAASAVTEDIYKPFKKGNANEKTALWLGRIAVVVIAILAWIIAANPNSGNIMSLVENAWAGFGSAFGPVILLSLYWRRLTYKGALAGILGGGATMVLWLIFAKAATGIYELLPGFLVGLLCAYLGSKLDKAPSKEINDLFDRAIDTSIDD
ncbi:MAG: sodium/proline symporter PutP [Firmicutes bacterium]|nr:sodium/proline symporter PutP [Bacillota bacterium]